MILHKLRFHTGVFFSVLLFSFLCRTAQAKDPSFYANESKMASGTWIKLQVSDNAIYKLTYEEIQAMGIDPSKASIHGYGGWMLNENFAVNDYADDLPEVPVWISGGDNKLDPGEFLLFYGKGPVRWSYDNSLREYVHENNPYSNYGYYFITDATGITPLIQKADPEGASGLRISTFDDYAVHEKDQHFIISTGRELYGESFSSSTSQNFRFQIEGMVNEDATARLRFISAASITSTSVTASINGSSISHRFTQNISKSNPAYACNQTWRWQPNGSMVDVNVRYSHSGYTTYLDYIRLNVKRSLKSYGAYTFFRQKQSSNNTYQYEIGGASENMFVLEITPQREMRRMSTSFSNGNLLFPAKETTAVVREYVVIDPSKSFPKPAIIGQVGNQNLHGLQEATDMIILTQPIYREAAQVLADKHKELSNLNVAIVDVNTIYNEFSSGTPDATAYRRFMKMLYDRGVATGIAPKYLLLMGDASHDNRLATNDWRNYKTSSLLLSYQSQNSLVNTIESYITDDYFGYLKDDNGISNLQMQVGIGRLPVNNAQEAATVVNKIIAYMENKALGSWKNRTIFIGGDEKDSGQYLHIKDANEIADETVRIRPEMFANKIFYNSFKKETSSGYDRYPGAEQKFNNKMKEGAFFLNYLGHGDPAKVDKNIINISSINQMRYKNSPIWFLGTCEFSRYDDIRPSAGELALLNASSAAIATISAARIVYVDRNVRLNKQIVNHLFNRDEDGNWPRLGDVMRKSKNAEGSDKNKLSYVLLGDPALPVLLPEFTVRLDSVNGEKADNPGIQFRAEELLTLKGSILNWSGEIETEFNGQIETNLMDCINHLETYDYRGTGTYLYDEYQNLLYQGKALVSNGKFALRIPVPRDISFRNEVGKLSFYAADETTKKEASGAFANFTVGGSIDREEGTEVGSPKIKRIYLNSPHFVNGNEVNETPYFVAEVYDSIGINRSGVGIGHNIALIIDNKKEYSLNAYYEDVETEQGAGVIRFLVPDSLAPGKHTLTFRVWNIMNKSATQTVEFRVEPGKAPVIYDLMVSANPAKTDVYFIFEHDRPETEVKVSIGVFDLTGCQVWSHEETGLTDELAVTPVYWDLTNNGRRVKPGVYVYRASISSKYGKESTTSKKLIILAQ